MLKPAIDTQHNVIVRLFNIELFVWSGSLEENTLMPCSGGFSSEGITSLTNGSFVNCSSDHLTSFAVLVNVGDVSPIAIMCNTFWI